MAWRTPQDKELLVSEHTRSVLSQLQSNPNVTRWALQASGKGGCRLECWPSSTCMADNVHSVTKLDLDAHAEPFWQTSVQRLELLCPHL